MLNYFKKISYGVILLIPSVVLGVQAFFVTSQSTVGVNKEVVVEVYVDTENISANAVEGKIVFPKESFEVVNIQDGNSAINFWVDRPRALKGSIVFSGIIPGGFTGKMYLFSIVFKAKIVGDASIDFDDIRVLKNDGTGDRLSVDTISNIILIVQNGEGYVKVGTEDTVAPEDFKPEVVRNDEMFEGKYFIVFVAQDKDSGVDRYQIKEGFWDQYKDVLSPFVLNDQGLHKKVYIKAIDKKGNERVVTLNPQNPLPWYRNYTILGILLLVCLVVYSLRKIWRRSVSVYLR